MLGCCGPVLMSLDFEPPLTNLGRIIWGPPHAPGGVHSLTTARPRRASGRRKAATYLHIPHAV